MPFLKCLIYSTLLFSTVFWPCFSDEATTLSALGIKLKIMQLNRKVQDLCVADQDKLRNCPVFKKGDYSDFIRYEAPPNTYLCFFRGVAEEEEGKLVMIAGDERAAHMYSLILDEDVRYAHAFVVVIQEGCTVFPTLNRPICSKLMNMLPDIIKKYVPDILIINQRLDNVDAFSTPFESDEKADRTVNVVTEYLQDYARVAKKIIILQPFPSMIPVLEENGLPMSDEAKPPLIDELLWANKTLESYHFNPYTIDAANAPGWNRLKESVNDCDECVIIETLPLFLRETPGDPDAGKQYIMYNEDQESYFCGWDLSHKAVELYMNNLFQEFESNADEELEDPAPYGGAAIASVSWISFLLLSFIV
uniref:SGNH domain-containing protein n=1 Tax=Panagrellus redivivus TaxID=6233 RepID=A0A7E4ZTD4_PANRE